MEVRIDKVQINDRMRLLDMAKVAMLAGSINEVGLLNPITVKAVNSHYELVAGYHRLEAFKVLQRATIPAQLFEGDDLTAELAEIDENLRRNDLTVLEQGEHLKRRNEILAEFGQRAKCGDNQHSGGGDNMTPPQTTAHVAADVGLSERTAQRRLQVATDILPEVKDVIRNTDVADNMKQLLDLSRMQPEEQKIVADAIQSGKAEDVNDAKYLVWASGDKHPLIQNLHVSDDSYEWYTPAEYTDAARVVMGSIDLDPASCKEAQATIKAGQFYTKYDNGLGQDWFGNVWLNPPYCMPDIDLFIDKTITAYNEGEIVSAIVLTNNCTDAGWFHKILNAAGIACFTKGRVKFWGPNASQARQGQTIFYLGSDPDKFRDEFSKFGIVVTVA